MNDFENNQIDEEGQLINQIHHIENKRKRGNVYCFFYKDNYPIITIGPHWLLSLVLSFFIIFGTYFVGLMLFKNQIIQRILQTCSGLFVLISFIITVLQNQGIVIEKQNDIITEKYCSICQINKQKGTYHCKDCNICIKGYDHHCVWVGKCVGEGNNLSFNIFLLATLVFFFLNFVILFI